MSSAVNVMAENKKGGSIVAKKGSTKAEGLEKKAKVPGYVDIARKQKVQKPQKG